MCRGGGTLLVAAWFSLSGFGGIALAHDPGGDGELHSHADPGWSFGSETLGRLPAEVPVQPALRQSAAVSASGGCAPVARTSDDSEHAANPASTPVIKVIYAHPSDVPDRFAKYAPVIDAGARGASSVVASTSGNTKSLRFDLGTSQGPECLDIQSVTLPLPTISYTAVPATAFTLIRTQVEALIGFEPGPRNYLIYADAVDLPGIAGEAQIWGARHQSRDAPRPRRAVRGPLRLRRHRLLRLDGQVTAPAPPAATTSSTRSHEMGHDLGAVQRSTPNHTSGYHCRDEWDILCYDDDGSLGFSTFIACGGSFYSSASEAWDCDHDDYFDPSPTAGSYLDTHWNLYRSVFLCQIDACGAGWATSLADRRAPATRIVKGPRRAVTKRTVTVRFASDEPESSFQCKLDRRRYAGCRSPHRLRRLKAGRHTFSVRAIDAAGNVDRTPAVLRFRIRKRCTRRLAL